MKSLAPGSIAAAACAAALLAFATAAPARAAETVKVTVGHMCCGSCKASATAGVKKLAWVGDVGIDQTELTITAKEGSKVDLAGLMDSLHQAGFPAKQIMVTGPVTVTVSHLCCGGCVGDLKAAMANLRSNTLDKDNVKIDQASRTIVLQPLSGQSMNVAAVLHQIDLAGFSAEKCTLGAAAATK